MQAYKPVGKIRKAFIATVFGATVLSTAFSTGNKGFSSVQKQGYLLEDVMLQSKGGHDLYYACKGDDITVKQTFDDGTCYVSVNNNVGYIPSDNSIAYGDAKLPNVCKGRGVSKNIVDLVNKQLLLIPSDLLEDFSRSGWSMIATEEDLNDKFYEGEFDAVYGSTSYDNHEVSIANSVEAATDAPLHEFGHWLDWYLNYPSGSALFQSIYEEENKQFYSRFGLHMHWDEKEFFAEGFDKFFTDRLKLETASPKLYSYMADTLHNLS